MTHTVVVLLSVLALLSAPAAHQASVSGIVRDAVTRAPLADATVMLVPPVETVHADPSVLNGLSVTTGVDGRFRLDGITPNNCTVRARKPGYEGRSSRGAERAFTLASDAPMDDVELLLIPAGAIVGRVVDPSGVPVAGSLVVARRQVPGSRAPQEAGRESTRAAAPESAGTPVWTDDTGTFLMDELPPGRYYVRASPPMEPSLEPLAADVSTTLVPSYYPHDERLESALAVEHVAGEVIDLGDLTLVAAAAFRVAGRVVDTSGRAVTGAMVRIVPAASPPSALPMGSLATRATSDANGLFAIDSVVAGEYLLVAVPPLVLERRGRQPEGRSPEAMSFVTGGSRPEAAQGSVWTESKNGITVQFRDESGARQPVRVESEPLLGVTITVRVPTAP